MLLLTYCCVNCFNLKLSRALLVPGSCCKLDLDSHATGFILRNNDSLKCSQLHGLADVSASIISSCPNSTQQPHTHAKIISAVSRCITLVWLSAHPLLLIHKSGVLILWQVVLCLALNAAVAAKASCTVSRSGRTGVSTMNAARRAYR